MGLAHSPRIVTDGLVLALDAANLKSYDKYENLIYYSEEFDTGWTITNAGITTNATTAPDGTQTADKLVENSSTGNKEVNQGNITYTSGTYLTFSCFAKAAGRTRFRFAGTTARFDSGTNAFFDLSNGTIPARTGGFTSASIEAYPNGWYRCVGTMLPTSSGTNNVYITLVNSGTTSNYTGDGSSGIFIWGAQLERGSYVTDYYKTTGTAKTRGTTWTDLSGKGNNGTLTNGPTYSSDNGGSIVFDGVDDYTIGSAVLPSGQQKYTISAWWKTSANNIIQVVWEQNTSTLASNTRAALLLVYGNWGLNGQGNDAHNKVPVRINQWTNGVITVDTTLGSNPIKIYENGFLYWQGDTGAGASNLNVGTSGGAVLGRKISTNSEYFIGTIAQTQIYDRVLTAQEIQQNFNALRGRFGI